MPTRSSEDELSALLKYHIPTSFCYSARTKVDCLCGWQGVHFDEHMRDLILSRWPHIAGPQRIDTVEELDALPVGSVILLGPDEPAVKRFHDEWVVACSPIECTTEEIGGAFIGGHSYPVLFRPDTTNPEEGTR